MPRVCQTCTHPDLAAINRALLEGLSRVALAAKYGISADSLGRHAAGHIAPTLVQAKKAADIASADALLDFLEELRTSALAILREAEQGFEKVLGFTNRDGVVVKEHVRDHELALEAIDRLTKLVELLAKVQGQLPTGPTVNIWVSAEWQQLRAVILTALAPFPHARLAVAAALSGQQLLSAGAVPALPMSVNPPETCGSGDSTELGGGR